MTTKRPTPWCGSLAVLLVAGLLTIATGTQAGTSEDPELADPEGDVRLEGEIPLPHGFAWADILALWYDESDTGDVTMRIEVLDAPMIPPPGEVSAHIQIDGLHWITGLSTVLFPFAVPYYQGGFYCPTTANAEVDPGECQTLPDVTLSDDSVHVPLAREFFRVEPGSMIQTHQVYSSAWYADISTTLDTASSGRPFNVSSPEETTEESTSKREDAPGRSDDVQNQDTNETRPGGDPKEAPIRGLWLVMAIGLSALALVRRRIMPRGLE